MLALLTPVLAKQSVWIIFVLRFLQVRLQLQSEAFLFPFFFLPAGDTLDSASFSHFFPQFCIDFVFFPGTCPECISSEAPLTSETSKNIIHLLTISMIRAHWRPSRSPR